MKKRRDFLKLTGLTGLGVAGAGMIKGFALDKNNQTGIHFSNSENPDAMKNKNEDEKNVSLIGLYGAWAAGFTENKLPDFSFRKNDWTDIEKWRSAARQRLEERLAIPEIGGTPEVKMIRQYDYDGLHIEELSWQLPYGRATEAILLKPLHAKEPLPAILAFHDHGGNKYFGTSFVVEGLENTFVEQIVSINTVVGAGFGMKILARLQWH